MTHWLVLPSPFLGPVAYQPLVDALEPHGESAAVATVGDPPNAEELVASWTAQALAYDHAVLLPHSNAGYLAPAVSAEAGDASIVFVDAALPEPGPTTRLAPAGFRDFLAGLADDRGLLPPWTRWWPRAEYGAALPGDWFDRIDAAAPRVPLSYVDTEVAVPTAWERGSRAYLAFGDSYADEWDRAGRAGWGRRRLDGGHLHMLVEPDVTARVIAALTDEARVR